MAIIIEHTAGKFPFWISPRQVCVLPLNSKAEIGLCEYASEVGELLHQKGFEVKVDNSTDVFNKKLAIAHADKYNFVLVVGDKDKQKNGATVGGRSIALLDGIKDKPEKYTKFMTMDEIIAMMTKLSENRDMI